MRGAYPLDLGGFMLLRANWVAVRAVRVSVLIVLLVLVGSLSSAAATYPVAQRGISVYWFPNYTWDPSSLSRYATVVIPNPTALKKIKKVSPTTKVLNFKDAMALADNCGTAVDSCQTAISYQQAQTHDAANPGDPWILLDASGKRSRTGALPMSGWRTSAPPPTSSSG